MTQNKSKHLALLVLTLLFNIELRAQSVHFNYGNGTNASYNLSDLRKITFDADLMNMHLFDGTVCYCYLSFNNYRLNFFNSINQQFLKY